MIDYFERDVPMENMDEAIHNIETILISERPRLLRLCTRLAGDAHVAEDLVQETLLEAWKHLEGLREPEKISAWLSGIARNVYLRWARQQGRQQEQSLQLETGPDESLNILEETLADNFDMEVELERKELAELLDRAMDLLSPETRTSLLERYVRQSSLSEVASLMGVNIHTASMRLKRGTLALRRVLTDEFKLETEAYAPNESAEWTQLALWCHHCGQHRLLGKLDPVQGDLYLKCPGCCPRVNDYVSWNTGIKFLEGLKSFKPALTRLEKWSSNHYRTALREGSVTCTKCGQPIPLNFGIPADTSSWVRQHNSIVIDLRCNHCDSRCHTCMDTLAFDLPEVQAFRRRYPRIRLLPPRQIEAEGAPALVATCESITSAAKIEVVATRERFDVLSIYGG
ncbi:hypothetical protein KSC_086130 [Ktedonobacter sp. SOSP1-52]|nr:hypothetical protein KSC_086130 [Ktedonobacter sp. SOSP1-52]